MTQTIKTASLFISLTLFALCDLSHAAVISFQGPLHDSTYIRQDQPSANSDNDPDDENIIGRGNATANDLNGLFDFNLTALANEDLGLGLEINSVTLTMYHRANGDGGAGSFTLGIHRYGFDFDESTSTWLDPTGDGSDTTTGGTFGTLLSSTVITNPSGAPDLEARVWNSTAAFTAAVEDALATDNALRLLAADISDSGIFDRFYDENQGVFAPLLQIDYNVLTPVPEPSSLLLLSLGLLALRRCGRRC